jgi:hypothetical protein
MPDSPKPKVSLYFNPARPNLTGWISGDYYASTLGDLYKQIDEKLKTDPRISQELYEETLPFIYADNKHRRISEFSNVLINGSSVEHTESGSQPWSLESKLEEGASVNVLKFLEGG